MGKKNESNITKTIRETIIKAAEAGEDLSKMVSDATRKNVQDALKRTAPTREKVESLSKDAVQEVMDAAKKAKLKLAEFFNKGIPNKADSKGAQALEKAKDATEKSLNAIIEASEKAAQVARDAIRGVVEGVNEVMDRKKQKPAAKKKTVKKAAKKAVKKTVKKTVKKAVKNTAKKS